ncbi:DUF5719 family protein [Microbacterium sp. bgisy203]|uniref:DUF5719 family protein n=1 Tax=Microbacterium sp. bgisy203 TaxID=3413799 RepID=UPI003D74FC3B
MTPSVARTARWAVGGLAAATAAAAVVALTVVGLPGVPRESISVLAQPPATPAVAACAGPLLATGRDPGRAAALEDAAAPAVVAASADGSAPAERRLTAPDVTNGAGADVRVATPDGDEPNDVAAASSARAADADLAGFAASACSRPAMESWLVTGAATTGASDLVVLSNPGDVPALVTLTLFGATGETAPAAGADIVVAAGTQRVIPLAALALGEENPVVRVTAAQTPVAASLQSSLTRVLDPGGVDQSAAVGAPSDEIVIPGVAVTLPPGESGSSEVSTTLRLLAPASDGTATVTVTKDGASDGASQDVPLTAGIPLQLDLPGLAVGTHTVTIRATTPVTGAVWSVTGFGAGSDFAWYTPAPRLTAETLAAVADGPGATLTLAASGDADQTVTVLAPGGTSRDVTVPAGRSASVAVDAGSVLRLVPNGDGVFAAISYAGTGALAGYPVPAGDAAASAIEVYPR